MRNRAPRRPAADGSTRRVVLGAMLVAFFAAAGPAAPELHAQAECEDVSGVWAVDLALPQGPQQVTVTLEQADCELSGLVKGNNETPIENGTAEGATFTFDTTVTNEATGESLVINWEGTIDGDAVSGSLTTAMGPVADFTGTRSDG